MGIKGSGQFGKFVPWARMEEAASKLKALEAQQKAFDARYANWPLSAYTRAQVDNAVAAERQRCVAIIRKRGEEIGGAIQPDRTIAAIMDGAA